MCLGCLFGSMVIGNSAAIVAAWALRFAFVLGGFLVLEVVIFLFRFIVVLCNCLSPRFISNWYVFCVSSFPILHNLSFYPFLIVHLSCVSSLRIPRMSLFLTEFNSIQFIQFVHLRKHVDAEKIPLMATFLTVYGVMRWSRDPCHISAAISTVGYSSIIDM